MSGTQNATGPSLAGASMIAACSCGAATGTVALLGVAGVDAANPAVHPFFVGAGASLLVWGLWQRGRRPGLMALGGIALLTAAAALAPPSVMTSTGFPHPPVHLAGFGLYFAAAAVIALAFLTAFPPPKKGGGMAAAGMAVAAGCTCCMVTGALAGLLGTVGIGLPWIYSQPVIFVAAMGLVTYGLWRMAGWKAAGLVPVGALVAWGGPELLAMVAEEMLLFGINMRWAPAYLITVAGLGIVFYGFVRAYRIASADATSAVLEGVELVSPAPAATVLGFHEAAGPGPLSLTPAYVLEDHNADRPKPQPVGAVPSDDAPDLIVLPSRGRPAEATTALDVAVPEGEPVVSPVTGTVLSVDRYMLYGRHEDHIIRIAPDARPDLAVKLVHLVGPEVAVGERVEAGRTPLAAGAKLLPFSSQIDRFTEERGL
ncbi:MAG: hypothetical protein KY453_06210, partial [Gemmatimonadetes bacterium]|nr:hypothetical protein [Gemmatimonadota bacterium]